MILSGKHCMSMWCVYGLPDVCGMCLMSMGCGWCLWDVSDVYGMCLCLWDVADVYGMCLCLWPWTASDVFKKLFMCSTQPACCECGWFRILVHNFMLSGLGSIWLSAKQVFPCEAVFYQSAWLYGQYLQNAYVKRHKPVIRIVRWHWVTGFQACELFTADSKIVYDYDLSTLLLVLWLEDYGLFVNLNLLSSSSQPAARPHCMHSQ